MAQFVKVDAVAEDGTVGPELVNVDEIATVCATPAHGKAKCLIYLRSLRCLHVLQAFTWFESRLKSRADS